MKKYKTETIVGFFVVIGLLCIGYMTFTLGEISFLGDNTYPLNAKFGSVAGLKPGSPVEMLGLEVGRVEELSIDQDHQMAVAQMKIRRGIKIYDDAIASVKTAGLIGDKYIQIDPGGSGTQLKPGGTITETSSPLDIEDLIGKYAFGDVGKNKKDEKKDAE